MLQSRQLLIKKLSSVQRKATNAILSEFRNSNRVSCNMACATGKSRVCVSVIQKNGGEVSVIVVPTLQLVQQMIGLMVTVPALKSYSIVPVCSEQDGESPEDWNIQNATTDPRNILSVCRDWRPVIVVVTYQSFPEFAKAIRGKVTVDLLVADEAHRTAGTHGAHWTECLDDKKLKIGKRLFMTATPVVYRGGKNTAYSMTDEKIYGKTAFEYSYRQAYEDGVVAIVKTTIFSIPTETAANAANKLSEPQQQAFLAESLAAQMLRPRQKTKMLVFHNSLAASRQFADKLRSLGVWAEHLHGEMKVRERLQKIDEFSAAKRSAVICAVRVFSEGIDAPEIDTIVFADRKSGTTDIVQSIGRGTRWSDRKNYLLVVLPYFTDRKLRGKQIEHELLASKYGPLSEVVSALENMDDTLCEYRVLKSNGDQDEEAADSEEQESDQDEVQTPLVRRVSVVTKLPVLKVMIRTEEGEFYAEDVRRKYMQNKHLTWPYAKDLMQERVLQLFGVNRPNKTHPLYMAFLKVCEKRDFRGREVLDSVYGVCLRVWPKTQGEMKAQLRNIFGHKRPSTKHPQYRTFCNVCIRNGWSLREMLAEEYGGKVSLTWPKYDERNKDEILEQFGFGSKRPSASHPSYESFNSFCRNHGVSAKKWLDEKYGVRSNDVHSADYLWGNSEASIKERVRLVFGDKRPTTRHSSYNRFYKCCRLVGLNPTFVLDDEYGEKTIKWPRTVGEMRVTVRKVFGDKRPSNKHPMIHRFYAACKHLGIGSKEMLDIEYGGR